MKLILTQEQKGLQLLAQRHGETGQMAIVEKALARAINAVNQDLLEDRPDSTAGLWTPEKRDKVRRLFGKTMILIAEAVQVPPAELLKYVLHGVVPSSETIADPDDIRWRGETPPAPEPALQIAAPATGLAEVVNDYFERQEDNSIDGDALVVPDRDDDEAELARLAELEDAQMLPQEAFEASDVDPAEIPAAVAANNPHGLTERREEVRAVAPRFQEPAAAPAARQVAGADVARPSDVVCLMDEMGRYLHESLDGMTTNPRFAWKGGADKVNKIVKQLPHLKQLDQVAFTR